MILTTEAAEKLRSELLHSSPDDLATRIYGPNWRDIDRRRDPRQRLPVPHAADIAELVTSALTDQLGYDGTRGNTTRGRQSGFWWKTPEEGWQPVEITSVVKALDTALRSVLTDAIATRDELWAIKNGGQQRDDSLRVELIEVVRRFVTSAGNQRGQLVQALRESGEFNLGEDAYLDMARHLIRLGGPAARVQLPVWLARCWLRSRVVVADYAEEKGEQGRKGQTEVSS